MARSIEKAIDEGKEIARKQGRLDLGAKEIDYFYNEFLSIAQEKGLAEAIFRTVGHSYLMELAVGKRN